MRARLAAEDGDDASATSLDAFAASNVESRNGEREDTYAQHAPTWKEAAQARLRKPEWLKLKIAKAGQGSQKVDEIRKQLRKLKLSTVCEEAKCPNIGECWSGGNTGEAATATIMLMGDTCTRGCRFCSVKTSRTPPPLDAMEPENVSQAVASWGIEYIVLTMVDRDDLEDSGAAHVAETVRLLKQKTDGKLLVETLVGDFQGNLDLVRQVAASGMDVFAHNVETTPRMTPHIRDRRAGWEQSLRVLEAAKLPEGGPRLTKTSLMLGLGEEPHEVEEALRILRETGVDVVTLGQYMRPTKRHAPVVEYVTPEAFQHWQDFAENLGFEYVASGPLVRSSYRAGELFLKGRLRRMEAEEQQQQRQR